MGNKTRNLAEWFVREVLNRAWTIADYGGTHMAHAKKLLKDYKLEDIKACIMQMEDFPETIDGWEPHFEFKYMTTILKGEPPYIVQFLTPPDPPPVYEEVAYDEWVRQYGKKAIEAGVWNGIYYPIGEPGRLTYEDITNLGIHKKQNLQF